MENAHHQVGGASRGRRYATQQINLAYAVLLSSQFQGYCRDLHSECVDYLVTKIEVPGVTPVVLRIMLNAELLSKRKLDAGNPNPGNIGEDFNRLGVDFWRSVKTLDSRNINRHNLLTDLNNWLNAIAHHNFDPIRLRGVTSLRLNPVRIWRRACNGLAVDFDRVMCVHIGLLIGVSPW